jgi:hypothetical protein
MGIIPSGKKRIMVAQQLADMDSDSLLRDASEDTPMHQPKSSLLDRKEDRAEKLVDEMGESQEEDRDVRDFIFETLVSFGYPPRRLEEYEDNFIKEEFDASGISKVTITIPDSYYGKRKRLSKKAISKIVNTLQKEFHMLLTNASRADKKVIFNLETVPETPKKGAEGEEIQEAQPADALEEAFGPSQSDSKRRSKSSSVKTQREIFAASLTESISRLKSGGSNG